eukprot:1152507-Pelagomonas_calceolata.AAC.6
MPEPNRRAPRHHFLAHQSNKKLERLWRIRGLKGLNKNNNRARTLRRSPAGRGNDSCRKHSSTRAPPEHSPRTPQCCSE